MKEKIIAVCIILSFTIIISAWIYITVKSVLKWLKNDYNHKYYIVVNTFTLTSCSETTISTALRKVKAKNQNEAIGIYLEETIDIEYTTKGNVMCWEWDDLTFYSSVNK